MPDPKNILIARLSSIGDIILTTPVIRAVRNTFPDARITFLVKEEFLELLKFHPSVNELITFRKSTGIKGLLALRKNLRSREFDCFIDLHNNLRTRFLRQSLHFRISATYGKESLKRWLLVTFRINLMKSSKPVFLKYFDAVKSLGISYDEKGTEIFTPAESRLKVIGLLTEAGIDQSKPLFVLCPGASFSNKQWLPERFAELAGLIMKEMTGQVVFLGGPGDRAICDSIISMTPEKALNLAGKLTLLESAALAQMASCVVSNDSGMMHLAQSQGTAVVAIFGPTSRELGFFPLPQSSRVVEHNVSCRPCTTKGLNHCPKGHFLCMKGIEAATVFEAIRNIAKKSVEL